MSIKKQQWLASFKPEFERRTGITWEEGGLAEMVHLNTPDDSCGHDSAKSIVLYFLANASTYRGEKAKALKLELKTLCNIK